MTYLYVFIGGGFGSVLRYGISRITINWNPAFPYGTLIANLIGTFLIGIISVTLIEKSFFRESFPYRELIMIGFLGGLTTFSSFMLDISNLGESRNWFYLFFYLSGNTLLGLAILYLGKYLAKLI